MMKIILIYSLYWPLGENYVWPLAKRSLAIIQLRSNQDKND